MGQVLSRIMGMPININVDDGDELKAESAIDLANDRYEEVKRANLNIVDSNTLRALAIFDIVMELQTIKGEQEDILDKNVKKINDLIKMVDGLSLPD